MKPLIITTALVFLTITVLLMLHFIAIGSIAFADESARGGPVALASVRASMLLLPADALIHATPG